MDPYGAYLTASPSPKVRENRSDPRDDRVFHVAGLGGHGVAASYSVGRLAAGMILGGRSRADRPFAAARLLKPDLSQGPTR